MYRRNPVRARIMREMLQGLPGDQPSLLETPADAALPLDGPTQPAPSTRWWRVGRFFRRQEAAHNSPQVSGVSESKIRTWK